MANHDEAVTKLVPRAEADLVHSSSGFPGLLSGLSVAAPGVEIGFSLTRRGSALSSGARVMTGV
jgi:hypothetical protein